MTYPSSKDINLLELLLTSMKGGSKYPFELNYLVGTMAELINPSDKRAVSYNQDQINPSVIADLKELYNCVNAGRSWRGIPIVIAISNVNGDPVSEIIMPAARDRILQAYPLVGTTLGSVNKPFGSKDECIIIGNYDNEALMKELRMGLNPSLRLNYDIPNGFITRALYNLSEAAVKDIGQKFEQYGKNFYVARSSSDGFKVYTNFYFSETATPNEIVKREFTFKCISTDPVGGAAPFEVKAELVQGESQPKLINNATHKVIGFSQTTKLMDELRAAGDDSELSRNFSSALDDAMKHGVTSMYSEGRQLQFSEMNGSVMVQDPSYNEATMVTPNPADPNNLQLQAMPPQGMGMPVAAPQGAPMAADPAMMGMPMMAPQGAPMAADPSMMGQPLLDPNTGQPIIDPNTGQPMMAPMPQQPGLGLPIDPATGQPIMPQQGAMPVGQPPMTQMPQQMAPGANSLQQVDQGAIQGTFSGNTEVMNRLYSDSAENEAFRREFYDSIDKAFSSGSTSMNAGGSQLNFAAVGGDVFVEDPGRGELTKISQNMYSGKLSATPLQVSGAPVNNRLFSVLNDGTQTNEQNKMGNTYLMDRLFSAQDRTFENNFAAAIREAAIKGSSYYRDQAMGVKLYSDGDTAIAEDEDTGEQSVITVDEAGKFAIAPLDGSGEDDSEDDAYGIGEYPADDIVNNIDNGNAMNPDVYTKIDNGIDDPELAGLLGDPSESFGANGPSSDIEGDIDIAAGAEDDEDEGEDDEDDEDEDIDTDINVATEEEDEDEKTFSALTGGLSWRMFSGEELEQIAAAADGAANLNTDGDESARVELPFDDIAGNVNGSYDPQVAIPSNVGIEDDDLAGYEGEDPAGSIPDDMCMGCEEKDAVFSCKDENGVTYRFSEEDMVNAITDNANEMIEKVKELEDSNGDKNIAKEVAEAAKNVKAQAELLSESLGEDSDVEDVRNQCSKAYSYAQEVLSGKYDSMEERTYSASTTKKADKQTSFSQLLFSTPTGPVMQGEAPMSIESGVEGMPAAPAIPVEAALEDPDADGSVVIENITVNGDMNVGGAAPDDITPSEPRNFSAMKMFSDNASDAGTVSGFSRLLFSKHD